MKLCVVLNASAGSLIGSSLEKTRSEIEQGFNTGGNSVDVRTPEGAELVETLKAAVGKGFDAIVVGGGDGTIATAAAICAEAGVPLGVLPLGTMNMLAKDLQIPLDLGKAIQALGNGEIRAIDMGEVNGEVFLCNSTIGLVPLVGQERENQRGKWWGAKITGIAGSVLATAWRFPGWRLSLEYDGHKRFVMTRLLTVANNAYEEGSPGFLTRSCLDGGKLAVYLSRHRSRSGFMWFGIGLLLHFWQRDKRIEMVKTDQVIVRRRHKATFHVSNDGEIKRIAQPLVYRIRPGALKVLGAVGAARRGSGGERAGAGMKVLAHISDLHFGRTDPQVVEGLLQDLTVERPHLIVISGDLTQTAKVSEFKTARAFLDRLPAPYFVIPGNHDVPPVNILERFVAPFARYRHYISQDMAPRRIEDDYAIIGVNTARRFRWRWNWALGSISRAQIEGVRDFFTPLSSTLFKIVVTHHPFLPPPDTPDEDLAAHAAQAIPVFEECGVDLILSGHLHKAYQGEIDGHSRAIHRSILVAQASTATSTRTRHEPNAYNSIILQENRVGFRVRSWKGDKFEPHETAWYAKEQNRWIALSPAAEGTPRV